MITKTYLDGKLRSLEERLERKINMKDERIFHEVETDIASLKDNIRELEEKFEENRDLIGNYLESQNGIKRELEEIKLKIENKGNKLDAKPNKNSSDAIISDI